MPPPPPPVFSMAASPSSASHHENSNPQTILEPPSATASRRVPPPCWSPDETVALIDAYRRKWYSLRRGNLRSHHWQEVAVEVAAKFPASPKTSLQCRHKMEKLRKRYRGEKQRAAFSGRRNSRFKSNWAHFKHMDDMERAPGATNPDDQGEEDDDVDEAGDVPANFVEPVGEIYRNSINCSNKFAVNDNRNVFQKPPMINGANGYRIRLPERSARAPASAPVVGPTANFYASYDEFGVPNPNPNPNPNIRSKFGGSSQGLRNEHAVRGDVGRKVGVDVRNKGSPTEEMAEAIRVLGDRFVTAEKMKMDMAREIEGMRMEMEMKRTAMILDSQQLIVEAFADAVFGRVSKKHNKMQTPDC